MKRILFSFLAYLYSLRLTPCCVSPHFSSPTPLTITTWSSGGRLSSSLSGAQFTYVTPPSITSMSPNVGSCDGGMLVSLGGSFVAASQDGELDCV